MPQLPRNALFGKRGRHIKIGPFVIFSVRSNALLFDEVLSPLYEDFPTWPSDAGVFPDFQVEVKRVGGLRRWLRPQTVLDVDGLGPFIPQPANLAPLSLEGGLNWLFAVQVNFGLALHAAVVERGGRAVIMPGPAGAGKSTLCAILVHHGWRLFSDEFALISIDDRKLNPLVRPISLKNRSIDLIRHLVPDCVLSRGFSDTPKGTVALLKPPLDSVRRMDEKASSAWIIMPKYVPDAEAVLAPKPKAEAFRELIEQSHNYHRLGKLGFTMLADLVDGSDCYDFRYSNPEDAIGVFDRLASTEPSAASTITGVER